MSVRVESAAVDVDSSEGSSRGGHVSGESSQKALGISTEILVLETRDSSCDDDSTASKSLLLLLLLWMSLGVGSAA